MADSPSAPILPSAFAPGSSSVLPSDFHDALEDVCSICLESFATSDPAVVTTCKHEYHLQCILDWSQRSKACPICWQSLELMDPSSQEVLAAVQIELRSRPRQFAGTTSVFPLQDSDFETAYEPPYTGATEFSERILHRMAAAMNRARYAGRSQRQSPMERGASESPLIPSHAMSNGMQMHIDPPQECHSPSVSSGYSSPSSCLSPVSPSVPVIHSLRDTDLSRDGHYMLRPVSSQSLPNESQRASSPDMFAFSDSIKSKFSAASAKYKHSFSKGTQGFKDNFKEKFSINNSSVKELSRGVQREVSAGIAGLTKMIDRLEIKSKRGSQIFSEVQRPFDIFSKGKQVQEDVACHPPNQGRQMEIEASLHHRKQSHSIQSSHQASHAKDEN
ncbi:hypothetical protein V2J09_011419 [Rumex salicifolius]